MGIFEFNSHDEYENIKNGVYIQFKNNFLTLNYTVNKQTVSIPYKSWNIDNFNSDTTPNASNIKIIPSDFINSEISVFILSSWNGPTSIMFGFVINGSMFPAHLFNYNNLPSVSQPKTPIGSATNLKLPITYQIYTPTTNPLSPLKQSYTMKQLTSSSHIIGGNYKLFGSRVSICPTDPISNYIISDYSKNQSSDNQIAIMFRSKGGLDGPASRKIIKLLNMNIGSLVTHHKNLNMPQNLNVFKYKLQIITINPIDSYRFDKGEIIDEKNELIDPNSINWSSTNCIDYYVPHGLNNEPKILFVNSYASGHVITSGYGAGIANINLNNADNIVSHTDTLTQYDILVLTVGRVVQGSTFDTCLYTTADFIVN